MAAIEAKADKVGGLFLPTRKAAIIVLEEPKAKALKIPLGNHRAARQRINNKTRQRRIFAQCVGDGSSFDLETGVVFVKSDHIPEPHEEGPLAERETMCLSSSELIFEREI